MQAQDITIAIADLDGTPRLTVDQAHGYSVMTWSDGWQWVRETVTSRTVDDEFEVNARKGPATLEVLIRCNGATGPAADWLQDALIGAVSSPFLLTRTSAGVARTWRCRAADWAPSFTTEDWINHRRRVALSIPASPHVTTTGTVHA